MQADWDAFCGWLVDDLELGKIPVEWSTYEKDGVKIVRIDIFKDRPFHVTTALADKAELCTGEVSYRLARGLLPVIGKAIDTRSPYTYIQYFRLEVV